MDGSIPQHVLCILVNQLSATYDCGAISRALYALVMLLRLSPTDGTGDVICRKCLAYSENVIPRPTLECKAHRVRGGHCFCQTLVVDTVPWLLPCQTFAVDYSSVATVSARRLLSTTTWPLFLPDACCGYSSVATPLPDVCCGLQFRGHCFCQTLVVDTVPWPLFLLDACLL
jgi:hypothetical protein